MIKSILIAITITGLAVALTSCAGHEETTGTTSTTTESTTVQPVTPTTTTTQTTTAAPY